MRLSRAAALHVLRIVLGLSLALGVGWLFDRPAAAAALYLGTVLLWQTAHLVRFERWLRLRSALPPPSLRGLWGEVVAVAHRIHQRKRFHKRRVLTLLRELRRMTSAMPDGAILLGPTREVLWFNRTAGQWLGLRRKIDYGLRIDNLIRQPEFVAYVRGGGGEGRGPRITLSQADHRTFAFDLVTTNEWGLQLMIVRDVTSETRLESVRRDFVANASHELRSPLTVVSGYLDTLVDDPSLDADWREPVREMQRQAARMGAIVNDLLELSRLEADGAQAASSPVDVARLLGQLRGEMARPQPSASLELHLDSDALLLGAESELHSVFRNLIANAVAYTPAEGRIDVRYWTDPAGAHVAVADTGIGIPASHFPRLTERFYRVDAGRSRRLGGSGLGLAIVKHALQRHGARLDIESVEGQGSVFTCHFPPSRVSGRAAVAAERALG